MKKGSSSRKSRFNKLKFYLFIISLILILLVTLNTYLVLKYNVLPFKYLIIYLFLFVLIPLFFVFFFFRKKNKKRKKIKITISIFCIIYIIILFFMFFYLNKTFNFLDSFNHKYETRNYYILVASDSKYDDISDLEDLNIGYFGQINGNYDNALKKLGEILVYKKSKYDSFDLVKENLYNNKIAAILVSDSYYEIECESDAEFANNVKVIYDFSLTEKLKEITKEVNVTKDTFNIYLSGIDSYGSVTSLTRSDVNMVVSINPSTNQILMINVPRDYYVNLAGINKKDKLTHAGMYGIETSVGTLEELLDIEINYYVKVNYTALVKLIDALGGVDVYSKYTFTSGAKYYTFKKGYNHVNGDQALEFVRTRKAFKGGDRVRGENQQAMIQAIIKKAASAEILARYTNILDSLEGSFATDLSVDKISDLIKLQLDKMPSWNITSISLNGTDSSDYTYLYPDRKLYVMEPVLETVEYAKNTLAKVKNGEMLDSSYEENINNAIYNPTVNKPIIQPEISPSEDTLENKQENILPDNEIIQDNTQDNTISSDIPSDNNTVESDEVLDDFIEESFGIENLTE